MLAMDSVLNTMSLKYLQDIQMEMLRWQRDIDEYGTQTLK